MRHKELIHTIANLARRAESVVPLLEETLRLSVLLDGLGRLDAHLESLLGNEASGDSGQADIDGCLNSLVNYSAENLVKTLESFQHNVGDLASEFERVVVVALALSGHPFQTILIGVPVIAAGVAAQASHAALFVLVATFLLARLDRQLQVALSVQHAQACVRILFAKHVHFALLVGKGDAAEKQ